MRFLERSGEYLEAFFVGGMVGAVFGGAESRSGAHSLRDETETAKPIQNNAINFGCSREGEFETAKRERLAGFGDGQHRIRDCVI